MDNPLRTLAQGYPGTGKTGALSALLNTGRFRVALIDFERNELPLLQFTKPEFHKNILIARCRDKLIMMDDGVSKPKGTPTAFRQAWRLIDEFKGVTGEGKEQSWGPAVDFSTDTVLAVDGLTGMGEASMRRILGMMNRSTLNRRKQDWGVVQSEVAQYFDNLISVLNSHLYVISHLKMQSPKLIEPEDDKGGGQAGVTDDVAAELNTRMIDVIPTRLVPTIPGQSLAGNVAGMFPICLYFDKDTVNDKTSLVIRTTPQPAVDVKVPVAGLPAKLPIATGLLDIFNALNANGGKLTNGKNGKK